MNCQSKNWKNQNHTMHALWFMTVWFKKIFLPRTEYEQKQGSFSLSFFSTYSKENEDNAEAIKTYG